MQYLMMNIPSTSAKSTKVVDLIYAIIFLALSTLSFSLAATEDSDSLTVIVDVDHHPMSFELPDGKPAGLYVDIWNQWSKTTGIQVNIRLMSLKNGLQLVRDKQAIHAGLFKNEARERWADFSIPFHQLPQDIH